MTEPNEPDTTEAEDVQLAPDEQEAVEEEAAEQEQAPAEHAIRDDVDYEREQKELAKAKRSLASEDKRHRERIQEIMGEDAGELSACPLCTTPDPAGVKIAGYRFNVMPQGEQLAAVKAAIGEPVTPEYEKDRYSNTCDACKGYGRVRTGSKVPGQGDALCYECKGSGWVPVGPERASRSITAANGTPESGTTPVVYGDAAEPPEAAALKALGYIVVPPPPVAA